MIVYACIPSTIGAEATESHDSRGGYDRTVIRDHLVARTMGPGAQAIFKCSEGWRLERRRRRLFEAISQGKK
jgi:hypothetical protein